MATIERHVYRCHRYVVFRSRIAGPAAADHAGHIVFRLATPRDLGRLDQLEAYGRGSPQRAYVEKDGDWLFVACHGDRLVATRRYSRAVRDALMCRVVQLREGQMWYADVFCVPEYRNEGIGRLLGLFADRFLASRGYAEIFGAVEITNTASLRMCAQMGSPPLYYVSHTRIPFYERLRVSRELPKRLGALQRPGARAQG